MTRFKYVQRVFCTHVGLRSLSVIVKAMEKIAIVWFCTTAKQSLKTFDFFYKEAEAVQKTKAAFGGIRTPHNPEFMMLQLTLIEYSTFSPHPVLSSRLDIDTVAKEGMFYQSFFCSSVC